MLYCPSCPEIGVNIDGDEPPVPHEMSYAMCLTYLSCLTIVSPRHLRTLSLTLDGNHHANRYKKNADKLDLSLFDGKGYFPRNEDYRAYVDAIPTAKEVRSKFERISFVLTDDLEICL